MRRLNLANHSGAPLVDPPRMAYGGRTCTATTTPARPNCAPASTFPHGRSSSATTSKVSEDGRRIYFTEPFD